MKIAQHFRAFLDTFHYLPIPRIGRLEIIPNGQDPFNSSIIKKQIHFTPDNLTDIDSSLKKYISEKMKIDTSITESDLTCFSNSLRELLIQGFEAEIPDIGFLHAESDSTIKFSAKSLYYAAVKKVKKRIPSIATSTFWF